MTVCGSDFLVAFDVYAAMTIIDVNMLENNTEMLLKVSSVVENLPSTKKSWQHHCYICSNIFPTEFGLPSHVQSKHPENLALPPPIEIQHITIQL